MSQHTARLVAIVVIPVELVHQLLVLSSVHTVTVNGNTLYVAQSDLDTNRTLSLIFGLVEFVLVAPLLAGAMAKATADLYLGGLPDVGSVLSFAMSRLGAILLVTLLVGLSIVGGFILLVIPGIIIAVQNFRDPNVLVMLTLANMLGIVMLLFVAKALSRDNKVRLETV